MGRAMLITASAAVIIFGISQLGLQTQKKMIAQNTGGIGSSLHARNMGVSAIQFAMERLNNDYSWGATENSPWETTINSADVSLYIDETRLGVGTNPDTIMIIANSTYLGETQTVISTYLRQSAGAVPTFTTAIGIATDNFTITLGGSSVVSGNDASGTCADQPAITVASQDGADKVYKTDTSHLESNDAIVKIDPDVDFEPVEELIDNLANDPSTVRISGSYKGGMGTAANPQITFVEGSVKLTGGITEGYGILVIRSGGDLALSGVLELAGNFKFNGLVIFENAFDLKGRGTPDIDGSLMIGNTDGSTNEIDIDLSGSINVQYDCSAQQYADAAASAVSGTNTYRRMSIYE